MTTPDDTKARILLEKERRDATDKRIGDLEKLLSRLLWVILGGSFGVMVTVITAAVYIGGRLNAIESLNDDVDNHESRIQRLEEEAMRRDR